jgi:hypothetical protein
MLFAEATGLLAGDDHEEARRRDRAERDRCGMKAGVGVAA